MTPPAAPASRLPRGAVGDHDFVVVDTETTGLRVTDRPVEVAAVRISGADRRILGSFQSLVAPGCPVPREATAIHGLTDADLLDAPAPARVLEDLAAFAQGAIWLAHNAGYDAGILGMAYLRAGVPAPDAPVVDTCRLARSCIPRQPTYRLEHLGRLLNLAEDGYHRALADARVAAGVFGECVRRMGVGVPLSELARRGGGWLTLAGVAEAARCVPEGFDALVEAIATGRNVTLEYNAGGRGVARSVEVAPKVLYRAGDRHFLEAFCLDGRYVKSYRLERILSYRIRP